MSKKGAVYTSIGAVVILLFVLISFLIVSLIPSKTQVTGAAIVENKETPEETLPPNIVKIINNGRIMYIAKESLVQKKDKNYCKSGDSDEGCICPRGFTKEKVDNFYNCIIKQGAKIYNEFAVVKVKRCHPIIKPECEGILLPVFDDNGCISVYNCIPPMIICPSFAPPYCPNGKLISGGVDQNGCPLPPKCVPLEKCSIDKDCAGSVCVQVVGGDKPKCDLQTSKCYCGGVCSDGYCDYVEKRDGTCPQDCVKAECDADLDCPQIYCVKAPCPQYSCTNGKCVLHTCGDGICEEGEANDCPVCITEPCPAAPCRAGTCPEDCQKVCASIYKPVCGINGVTYGNSCEAKINGVEIAYEGECKQVVCTELSPEECLRYDYCELVDTSFLYFWKKQKCVSKSKH